MADSQKSWEIYEQAAQTAVFDLCKHLGVTDVEKKQNLRGTSGTVWQIDGKAVLAGGDGFLVIEARRHTTSGQKQESLAAFAYRIHDIGGAGGIIASPLPLQSGASIIATHENIHHLQLDKWSNAENYFAQFMGRAFHRITEHAQITISEQLEITVIRDGKVISRSP